MVYDILSMLGDLGGLKEALVIAGALLVSFFAQREFFSKIVRKIYQIRKYKNLTTEGVVLKMT